MNCDKTAHVHAYYDGELSPADRADMKAHFEQCGDCRDLLAELKQLSERVASAPLAEMPAETMARLQTTWGQVGRRVGDRGVLRIAGWLTAAAAAVLFGALMIDSGSNDETSYASNWQTAAVMPPAESQSESGELVTVAQWMASDLATDSALPQ